MMMEKAISRSIRAMFAGSLALGASMLAQPAFAEEAIQRVEVTGSSIKRVAAEAALPVQTFDQKDIAKTGVTTVTDFIQQLPVMQGFTVASDSVGGGGGGITTASIHDVGEQYTLVLLNGRRIAPTNSGSTINLNSIPLSAVERVEVLTDGASALYGSDAIAGVVNFILKKGAQPWTIETKFTSPQHPGGKNTTSSLSKGWGNLDDDGFTVFASYSHEEGKQLKASQRPFAKTGIIKFNGSGTAHTDPGADDDTTYAVNNQQLEFFNGSSRSIPPNVTYQYKDATGATKSKSFSPFLKANGVCPPSHEQIGSQCYFDYTSTIEIFPEHKADNFFGTGEFKLGASGFTAFGDFAYTQVDTVARIAPYPAEFSLAVGSPLWNTYVGPYLTDAQKANPVSTTVKYRLYEMGNRTYDYNVRALHSVVGVRGSAAGWDMEGALTYSENTQPQVYLAGFPLETPFRAALASGTIDPFAYQLGQMPTAMSDALKATGFTGQYNVDKVKMTALDAHGSREMFAMGGGSAQIAVGADYRVTKFNEIQSATAKNADILFDDQQVDLAYKRSNYGMYSEVSLPVTKKLEFDGSVRYDSFSGVDNGIDGKTYGNTQSSTTYKLSTRFEATKDLLFRASYGTGFRVASMNQIASPLKNFGVTGGSYPCRLPSSDPLYQYCYPDLAQYTVLQGGNADLKPEKSTQWTIGTVIEPTNWLSVKLDLWSVSIKDAVTSVSEDQIFGDPVKYHALLTTYVPPSTGVAVLAMKDQPINIGKSENRGIDYDFMARFPLAGGKFTGRLAGTHLLKDRYTVPGTDNEWATSLGQFGINNNVSFREVVQLSGTYDIGAWTHSLTGKYRSGYKDKHYTGEDCAVTIGNALGDCVDIQLDVAAYYTFDWQTQWRAAKGLTVTGGIVNMFDKDPPLSLRNTGSHQLGYDPRYASPLGRTYYVSAQYKF